MQNPKETVYFPDKMCVCSMSVAYAASGGEDGRQTERMAAKSSPTGETVIMPIDESSTAGGEIQDEGIYANAGDLAALLTPNRMLVDLQRLLEQMRSLSMGIRHRRHAMGASPGCKDVDVTTDFVRWAFDILISGLQNRAGEATRLPSGIVQMRRRGLRCPAFVTWYQRDPEVFNGSEDGYELRGCIGTLSAIPPETIGQYAWTAAQEDSRFPPVELDEVSALKGTTARNYLDWILGMHGLAAEFDVNGKHYSGVFLPQVLLQFETKENSVVQLIRKAEYFGPISKELLDSMQLTRFQGTHISLSFPEYKEEYGVIGQASRVQKDKLMEKEAESLP
ncbi:AMMECR1 family protein, related [Neospora caninum Liverpool]|uniref:AMMECR1 family protein, related n=1 Tax=Neospora caninum (strain Liverpool) TaxID=572307 RepID=F0VM20_NEOCL|nr:AMMECR1 family protein, related [Neospora caninum Liverpool]CBZ54298.1 AMMECR1 family protein, related [Neospora caninum Liverpool]|eukprot:XP_003884329.1 AMMECR1 family protein, related [Neospora caninum Liverpool]